MPFEVDGDYALGLVSFAIASSMLLGVLVIVTVEEEVKWEQIRTKMSAELSRFDFFFALLVRRPSNKPWCVAGTKVYSDAFYTVVVKYHGKPMGIIGFDLRGGQMSVRQLQGIKGCRVPGSKFGEYLLSCAEHIARALHVRVINVACASRQAYYVPPNPSSELYRNLGIHQARLRAMYDGVPEKAGYLEQQWLGNVIGRYKVLRKRVTFARFVRLHTKLFDRNAQHERALVEACATHE